jgi:hypothetical protein
MNNRIDSFAFIVVCALLLGAVAFYVQQNEPQPRKVYRGAITGRFVSSATVRRHPRTTETETRSKRKK